jgi:hypothetical protein
MFGFSKREKFERAFEISLMAIHGDLNEVPKERHILPMLKEKYKDEWKGLIKEGVRLNNPPELSAFILASINYRDIIINGLEEETLQEIRQTILDRNYDFLDRNYDFEIHPTSEILFRLLLFFSCGSAWSNKGVFDRSYFALTIKEVHECIFDESVPVMESLEYVCTGMDTLRDALKDSAILKKYR